MNLKDISFLTKYDKYLYDKSGNKLLSGDIFIMSSNFLGFVYPNYYILEYVTWCSKVGYIYYSYTIQDHTSDFYELNKSSNNQLIKISIEDIKSPEKQEQEIKYIKKVQRGIKYRSNWTCLPELIYNENCAYLTNGKHIDCIYKYPKIF